MNWDAPNGVEDWNGQVGERCEPGYWEQIDKAVYSVSLFI